MSLREESTHIFTKRVIDIDAYKKLVLVRLHLQAKRNSYVSNSDAIKYLYQLAFERDKQ